MARKRMLNTFREAQAAGPYGELPVLADEVDPQFFVSRNDRPQPFFLTCEKDTILVQMSGISTIHFLSSSVNYFKAVPGDFIYIPAGTSHRIIPQEESVQYRIKARKSGTEAVSFRCPQCGSELMRQVWNTDEEVSQEAYLRAVTRFNGNEQQRTCSKCGASHPLIDLDGYRWRQIADELKSATEAQAW